MRGLRTIFDWWTKPGTLAVDFHSAFHRETPSRNAAAGLLEDIVYWAAYPVVEAWSGVSLPREARVGKNLQIFHRGKVVVNPKAVIGDDCTIVHGVTIGNLSAEGGAPVIGNNVSIGAYAQLLGPITVGDGAKIGSLAIVLDDVPPGGIMTGQKAVPRQKVVKR